MLAQHGIERSMLKSVFHAQHALVEGRQSMPGCCHVTSRDPYVRRLCMHAGSFMGSFGQLDPASAELARFLQRLQAQQQQVMELIAEKESEFKSRLAGKPYVPPKPLARGLSGMGSFGLSALRSQASTAGTAQPSRFGPRPPGGSHLHSGRCS